MGLPRTPNVKTQKITLRRDGVRQAWGIRLVGGCDLGTPLIITRSQVGSPAEGELNRGDIIKKIGDYDSRDLSHEDAQNLFKNAGNTISLVIQRDQAQTFSTSSSRSNSVVPAVPSPLTMNPPVKGGVATPFAMAAHTPKPSSLSAPQNRNVRASSPVVFPPPLPDEVDEPQYQQPLYQQPPYKPTPSPFAAANTPSPRPLPVSSLKAPASRMIRASSPVVFPPPLPDEVQEIQYVPAGVTQMQQLPFTQFRSTPIDVVGNHYQEGDDAAISNQPYRTTPLVLPGAKVKKDDKPTESYLRHHPNPSFRAPPTHFDTPADVLMKQKVADTVLQRVASGDESLAGKQMVHKQFNSPIGLYSNQNIQETIQAQTHQTGMTPTNSSRPTTLNRKNQSKVSLKKTVSYDPAKSETFKALQEAELSGEMHEVTTPAQTRVFAPSAPVKVQQKAAPVNGTAQPFYNKSQAQANHQTYVNSLGNDELIHQSGTFKRLMHQVLGDY